MGGVDLVLVTATLHQVFKIKLKANMCVDFTDKQF